MAAYAWEEARDHYERGIVAKGIPLTGTEPVHDVEGADLLRGLCRAQIATAQRHQRPQVVNTMRRAFDYYAEAGDVDRAVAIAGYPWYAYSGFPTGMTHLRAPSRPFAEPWP